jgi:hypothetical protein
VERDHHACRRLVDGTQRKGKDMTGSTSPSQDTTDTPEEVWWQNKSVRLWIGLLGAGIMGALLGLCFLQEPGLGDDLDYWSLARRLNDGEVTKWNTGFHDLRWPVWGVIWLLQKIFGAGLASYYGEPLFYLGMGSAVVWLLARMLFGSDRMAWGSSLVFAMHPMLDPAIVRPMPDLSEGCWSAFSVLALVGMSRSSNRIQYLGWSVAMGIALWIGYANRITGLFIVPILGLLAVLFFRRTLPGLILAGFIAACCFLGECLLYHTLTGDFWHSLHANLGARGRKGTESVAIWMLPLRFFDSLWTGNFLKVPLNLLTFLGAWTVWHTGKKETRSLVVWMGAFYLLFSCVPQSFFPYRPLVRDGERFLASLAFPFALLVVPGAVACWQRWMAPRLQSLHPQAGPIFAIFTLLLLPLVSSRNFTDLGYALPMQEWIKKTPPGTKILTHPDMREVAILIGGEHSRQFDWVMPRKFFQPTEIELQAARQCDTMWLNRKLLWVTPRKKLEQGEPDTMPPLPEYLDDLSNQWELLGVFYKSYFPDIAFFSKRKENQTSALHQLAQELSVSPNDPRFTQLSQGTSYALDNSWVDRNWIIEMRGSANTVEAVKFVVLRFFKNNEKIAETQWKPYFHQKSGWDYLTLHVPKEANSVNLQVAFSKNMKYLQIDELKVRLENPQPTK